MTRSVLRAIGVLVLSQGLVAHAARPPVAAYARMPAMIDIDISPSGARLAWLEDTGAVTRLIVHDLAAKKDLRTITAPASLTLHAVYWANDDTVLLSESRFDSAQPHGRDAFELQRWTAIDAAGGPERVLLQTSNSGELQWVTAADLVRRHTSNPNKVFMSTLRFSAVDEKRTTGSRLNGGRKDEGWASTLFEVDLATGQGRQIAVGTPYTNDWAVDPAATRVMRSEWNPKSKRAEIDVKDGGGWKAIYQADGCGQLNLVDIAANDTGAIASGRTCDDETRKLYAVPFDGSAPRVVAGNDLGDVTRYYFDPYDGHVEGAAFGDSIDGERWLDPQAEARVKALRRTFGGSAVSIVARSSNYRRVVVRTQNDQQPPIYYLVDYDAKSADIVGEEYPLLSGIKLGAVRDFRYEARDRYPLVAFLTIPPGATEKQLPLVVLPHGGPEARDLRGFDWLAQFLASRGYAVLQPQFRGSTGLGRAHADAGRRQWGLRMQDDVTDGVKAAIDAGIVDPKRVCIVGWSYGGYAALAGAAFTPDLYACAASIAGVSDLPAMLGYETVSNGSEGDSVAYWKDHIGPANDPQVAARSPARSAATIRAPILLLHGTDDTIVPIAQSKLMAKALDSAKKPYEFVELPGDDHGLHTSATRVQMATELEKFLAKYLSPAAGAATAAPN